MTENSAASRPALDGARVTWRVDPDRRRLMIACRGGVTDADLLDAIPRIWRHHPEVIGYDSVVDTRGLTSEGGWSWPALREIARQWREFAEGRDNGRRTAIVTTDTWVAMLVGAFVMDYRGRRFRCFTDLESALEWTQRP